MDAADKRNSVEFQVLTAVVMKSSILWNTTPLNFNGLHGVISQKMELFKRKIFPHCHVSNPDSYII
jgi:hypothetical protein